MPRETNNFKLGLFILGGIFLLVGGLLALGARRYFEPKTVFETYVAGDVDGLAVGSAVELRGVQVGRVTRIDFSWNEYGETNPSYVVLEFEMRDDVLSLPPGEQRTNIIRAAVDRGLRARVKAKGVTGLGVLSIEYLDAAGNPPAQFPWTPRHAYIPAAPGQFGELLASVEKSLRNIERLDFGAINQLLQADLKSAGVVMEKLGQLDVAPLMANANSLLTDLRVSNARLQPLIGDIDETIGKLKPGLANFDFETLNQTLQGARRAFKDLDDNLVELKRYPSGYFLGRPPHPVLKNDSDQAKLKKTVPDKP